jgi:hypothetical protein
MNFSEYKFVFTTTSKHDRIFLENGISPFSKLEKRVFKTSFGVFFFISLSNFVFNSSNVLSDGLYATDFK